MRLRDTSGELAQIRAEFKALHDRTARFEQDSALALRRESAQGQRTLKEKAAVEDQLDDSERTRKQLQQTIAQQVST